MSTSGERESALIAMALISSKLRTCYRKQSFSSMPSIFLVHLLVRGDLSRPCPTCLLGASFWLSHAFFPLHGDKSRSSDSVSNASFVTSLFHSLLVQVFGFPNAVFLSHTPAIKILCLLTNYDVMFSVCWEETWHNRTAYYFLGQVQSRNFVTRSDEWSCKFMRALPRTHVDENDGLGALDHKKVACTLAHTHALKHRPPLGLCRMPSFHRD